MIQDPRNVSDLFRRDLFDAAQDKIVILGAFEPGAEANFLEQLRSENAQMGEKILGEEEGRIPVGFEMCVTASPHDVEFILVAVEQPRFRMPVDFEGDEIECSGREDIVVVEEGDKFPVVSRARGGGRSTACGGLDRASGKGRPGERVWPGGVINEESSGCG
jgi:hypothetical protein